jgi:hypothetical protein
MDAEPRGAFIAAHVESVRARTYLETEQLVSALAARCWPGQSSDRTDRVAIEWVRRWGPSRLRAAKLECSCAIGRCGTCN